MSPHRYIILSLTLSQLIGMSALACQANGQPDAEGSGDHSTAAGDSAAHEGEAEHEAHGSQGEHEEEEGHEEHGAGEHEEEGHEEHGAEEHEEEGHEEHGAEEHEEEGHEEHGAHQDGEESDEHGDHGEGEEHGDHEEGEHEESDTIELSAEALARSGIRTAPIQAGTLAHAIEVPAEIQLNPDRVAHVAPLVSGHLRSVMATVGDDVGSGQPLADLRSVDLGQARAEYNRARALEDVAESNFERQERLRDEGIASERALLDAQFSLEEARAEREAARARLEVYGVTAGSGPDMTLESPLTGRIIERHATQGENVASEDVLFIVADLSNVWVVGRIYEQDVARVHDGMNAILTLGAYPSRSWQGRVAWVSSTVDTHTRTLAVRLELDNPDGVLRPGLFGNLRLEDEEHEGQAVMLVPDTAIQDLRGRSVVFVPEEEPGHFRAAPVLVGEHSDGLVEVLEGLQPGTEVVVEGAFVLKSELMRGELGHGHAH